MGDRINVMLDLETMGLSMNSAIIQIGAVSFDLKHQFFCNVALQSALMTGMTMDPKTLAWWQAQGELAQASLCNQPIYGLHRAVGDFAAWFHELPGEERPLIWSHGAAFDVPLLGHAFELCQVGARPWDYRDVRDTRTVYAMAKERGWKPTELPGRVKHNAINDCISQIENLKSAWAFLDLRPVD